MNVNINLPEPVVPPPATYDLHLTRQELRNLQFALYHASGAGLTLTDDEKQFARETYDKIYELTDVG